MKTVTILLAMFTMYSMAANAKPYECQFNDEVLKSIAVDNAAKDKISVDQAFDAVKKKCIDMAINLEENIGLGKLINACVEKSENPDSTWRNIVLASNLKASLKNNQAGAEEFLEAGMDKVIEESSNQLNFDITRLKSGFFLVCSGN